MKLTKKDVFTMKLKDEPILIDCIELGLPRKRWATKEIINTLIECEVLVKENEKHLVVQHEIHSRVMCHVTGMDRVRKLEKGRKVLIRPPKKYVST